MTKLETYLFFDGNCAEAMHFYEQALGGTLNLVAAKDTPGGSGDQIMHSRLEADGATIMASDWFATTPYPGMSGFSVTLTAATEPEAKALFDKLADGGKVTMPFQKTFYSDGFGMIVDRFRTPWMVMAATYSGT
jgi:PhnB protein